MDIIFLIGRILFGGYFLVAGIRHLKNTDAYSNMAASAGVPSPKVSVILSGLLIIVGGAGVILGFEPVISLALIVIFLVPVTYKMHAYWKLEDPQQKMQQKINFEKNVALTGAALALMLVETPWVLSL